MIKLLTLLWLFQTQEPARSLLTSAAPTADFVAPADATRGFTVKLKARLSPTTEPKTLLEIANVLTLTSRSQRSDDHGAQNYSAFQKGEGPISVLEARISLSSTNHTNWTGLTIGIPLGMLSNPDAEHEVVLQFTGVRWTLYIDGELLDNEYPYGYPRWNPTTHWQMDPRMISEAALFVPAITPQSVKAKRARTAPIAYWSPVGHNTWVGDVATLYHQGRYHVFYLFDRRHHGSKFGQGAHYFEHLSTADFRTWTEHEPATPLEYQWECIGTGTPYVRNGKLCLAYGLHTERIHPDDQTTLPAQLAYLKEHGRTGTFGRNAAGVPIGATYSVSADGVAAFSKTWDFYHPCRNPSVYTTPDGHLRMLANHHGKGIWEEDATDGGWRPIRPDFPPGGDCTFYFRWDGFDYIIGGFTSLWSKPASAPETAYESVVAKGLDFYDGLNVPAISEIPGSRFLMAGWVGVRGWGGVLAIRELLHFPDGRIGSRWMPELVPATRAPFVREALVSGTRDLVVPAGPCLVSFDVVPNTAGVSHPRVAATFLPSKGHASVCEFQVLVAERRAQFASVGEGTEGFAAPLKSLREGGQAANSIENLLGMDGSFHVRIAVKGSAKLGGTVLDAEIAGQRTMISYRPDLEVGGIRFQSEGVQLRNLRVAAFSDPR